jgi:hypothetical protein
MSLSSYMLWRDQLWNCKLGERIFFPLQQLHMFVCIVNSWKSVSLSFQYILFLEVKIYSISGSSNPKTTWSGSTPTVFHFDTCIEELPTGWPHREGGGPRQRGGDHCLYGQNRSVHSLYKSEFKDCLYTAQQNRQSIHLYLFTETEEMS